MNDNLIRKTEKIDIILDTDTYNEMDDQFAVLWALAASDQLTVRALTAAPFLNSRSVSPADGMEKSYQELIRIAGLVDREADGLIFRGAPCYLPDCCTPVVTPAAERIVELARTARRNGTRLKILGIAALTNIASALLIAPEIADTVDVIWLGGQPYEWPVQDEFNFRQNVAAVRVVFESGALEAHIPCIHGAETLITTLPELEERCFSQSRVGLYLKELAGQFMSRTSSRIIWDISTVAYLCVPEAFWLEDATLPVLGNDGRWIAGSDSGRRTRLVRRIERDLVFDRLFERIQGLSDSSAPDPRRLSVLRGSACGGEKVYEQIPAIG